MLEALAYAKSMRPNRLLAVTVVSDEEEQEKIARQWAQFGIDVPLEIVFSPYRELSRPVLRFVEELDAQRDNDIVTVVIPEFVVSSWWAQLLHNQSALSSRAGCCSARERSSPRCRTTSEAPIRTAGRSFRRP